MLESLVRVLRTHPSGSQLLIDHKMRNTASLRATEVVLGVLRGAGFDAKHASAIARATLWTGITLVLSEPGFEPGMSKTERDDHQRKTMITLASQSPVDYPRIVECATAMTATDDPEFHYQLGVDMFIAAVESLATRQPPTP